MPSFVVDLSNMHLLGHYNLFLYILRNIGKGLLKMYLYEKIFG